jgi:hypothetical protein
MRGGRRFGQRPAQHRDGAPSRKATRPPAPPETVTGVEREAWLELRAQVAKARTYDPTRYSAFRLAVKALALVYAAPADMKPTSLRSLIESASRMLARFGLDSIAVLQAERAPEPKKRDEFSEYLDQ